MSTYTSPVPLAEFQAYLKDASTDPTVTGFFQTCLDHATEAVYTWLDRDYTASAAKSETFWGDGTAFYAPRHAVGTLTSWSSTDLAGTITAHTPSDLLIRANGYLLQSLTDRFERASEHTITYHLPATLLCPETVKQAITEMAAVLFQESNQGAGRLELFSISARESTSSERDRFLDLTERHKEMLRPYKRYAL